MPPPARRSGPPTPARVPSTPAARRTAPPPVTAPRTARDADLAAQDYPPGSRYANLHGSTRVVLTGYIHLVSKVEHTPRGGAIANTACGARDKAYVWGMGGLRITVSCSLVECPACRETELYWSKVGELGRAEAGRAKWAVA